MLEARGNNKGGCGCHAGFVQVGINQWLFIVVSDGEPIACALMYFAD